MPSPCVSIKAWMLLCVALPATSAWAQVEENRPAKPRVTFVLQPPQERPKAGIFIGEPGIDPEVMTAEFLSAHPDLRWRREAMYAYNRQEYAIALGDFLLAARYGDKPAQAMLAEMHWKGVGVPQDRALGYAWMDIAAERNYPNFVILRERYWSQLDAAEQRRAIEQGMPLMQEYGDAVAEIRLDKKMRRTRNQTTGSRVGYVGGSLSSFAMGVYSPNVIGVTTDPLVGKYHAAKYWKPEEYAALKDAAWKPERSASVSVERPQPVPVEATAPQAAPFPDRDDDSD